MQWNELTRESLLLLISARTVRRLGSVSSGESGGGARKVASAAVRRQIEKQTRKITSRNTIQADDRLILSTTELCLFFFGWFFEG